MINLQYRAACFAILASQMFHSAAFIDHPPAVCWLCIKHLKDPNIGIIIYWLHFFVIVVLFWNHNIICILWLLNKFMDLKADLQLAVKTWLCWKWSEKNKQWGHISKKHQINSLSNDQIDFFLNLKFQYI